MSIPGKGRADYLELGDWNAVCAMCGRKGKASEMRRLPDGVPGARMFVHPEHWIARNPQDFVRGIADKMAAPWSQQPADEFTDVNLSLTTDQEEPAIFIMTDDFEVLIT